MVVCSCGPTAVNLPAASGGATQEIRLRTNVECTFTVDGREVATGRLVRILVSSTPHRIGCEPPGYYPKEEYIQPPYDNTYVYGFTFMVGDRIGESTTAAAEAAPSDGTTEQSLTATASPSGRVLILVAEPVDDPDAVVATMQEALTELGGLTIVTPQQVREQLWSGIEAAELSPSERRELEIAWANQQAFELTLLVEQRPGRGAEDELTLAVLDTSTSDTLRTFSETVGATADVRTAAAILSRDFLLWFNAR